LHVFLCPAFLDGFTGILTHNFDNDTPLLSCAGTHLASSSGLGWEPLPQVTPLSWNLIHLLWEAKHGAMVMREWCMT
jgi:hypothetical protein